MEASRQEVALLRRALIAVCLALGCAALPAAAASADIVVDYGVLRLELQGRAHRHGLAHARRDLDDGRDDAVRLAELVRVRPARPDHERRLDEQRRPAPEQDLHAAPGAGGGSVSVRVDNDVAVSVNGQPLASAEHEGCANVSPPGAMAIPAAPTGLADCSRRGSVSFLFTPVIKFLLQNTHSSVCCPNLRIPSESERRPTKLLRWDRCPHSPPTGLADAADGGPFRFYLLQLLSFYFKILIRRFAARISESPPNRNGDQRNCFVGTDAHTPLLPDLPIAADGGPFRFYLLQLLSFYFKILIRRFAARISESPPNRNGDQRNCFVGTDAHTPLLPDLPIAADGGPFRFYLLQLLSFYFKILIRRFAARISESPPNRNGDQRNCFVGTDAHTPLLPDLPIQQTGVRFVFIYSSY